MLIAALVLHLPGQSQEVTRDGLYITVSNPIGETVVSQIKQRVQDAAGRQKRTLKVVVFDFNPRGKPSGTSNVFPCMELQHFISDLGAGRIAGCKDVLTVAYVREEVTDHTVLPVLACREIVMSSKGKLGNILGDIQRSKGKLLEEAHQAYVKTAGTHPAGDKVLAKMLDPSKNLSLFDLKEAQAVGLCTTPQETPSHVKDQYGLPALSMREDALEGRTPVVWRIEVHGALTGGKLNSLDRRIKNAIRKKANLIILHLDCEGGDTADAAIMAERLRNLTDESGVHKVKTIAYAPPGKVLGAATFLAVGCSEIAMAPDAQLGGFDYLQDSKKDLAVVREMLVKLAAVQGYHTAFFEAMLTPGAKVYYCRHTARAGAFKVLTADELKKSNEWLLVKPIQSAGEKDGLFSLDAKTAEQYGIARYSDITNVETLYARHDIPDSNKVEVSRDDWLDAVAAFLRSPIVNVILIMVGIAGLILELKMPGFGLPGIIAAICFVLFFWAHAFAGQSTLEFTLLAILLFVLGLVLLAIEIFVLPGFGVTGVSGIILIVVSLVLVLLEQMPATSEQWLNLGTAVTTVAVGLIAGLCAAMVLARYLPNMPYANRLILQPPVDESDPAAETTPEGAQAASLLGAIGVAATTLRPAGKAQFGEQFVDVVAEGDYVDAGARVQVIEIEGNRIVVKEL
jgi:membrane-bound ClpP family serine protease